MENYKSFTMKKSILILFVLLSTTVFSQSKKEILVQKWKLNKVEEFGQKYPPTENQKNDMIYFFENEKFEGIIENEYVEGMWLIDNNKLIISIQKEHTKLKINWTKVKAFNKDKIAIEYQNGDFITSTLIFIPAK